MRFLPETVGGSEKHQLVVADVENDNILHFCLHPIVFSIGQRLCRRRLVGCLPKCQ